MAVTKVRLEEVEFFFKQWQAHLEKTSVSLLG